MLRSEAARFWRGTGRIARPLWFRDITWLRGLDLNQRPLGYEYNTAMSGNPLILREKRSGAGGSTLSDDAGFFVSFGHVSGCYGSRMGAAFDGAHDRDDRRSLDPLASSGT